MIGINGLLDGYYKVMSNIPKMGHLPTPVHCWNPGLFKNDMWSVKPPRGWPPKRDGNLGNLSAAKSGASAAKNAWLVRP